VAPAHIHPTGVDAHVIDAVGNGLALRIVREVVDANLRGLLLPLPLSSALPEEAHQLLLLGVHRDDRLPPRLEALHLLGNMAKLRVPVRVLRALTHLAVGLQAVAHAV
jgi:hypothetical protein